MCFPEQYSIETGLAGCDLRSTVDPRTSNGLMIEQLETRKSNKESRGRHVVAFSLCLVQMKEG
jgi:hypothetical protein